jgi:hypothetical protein
VVSHETKDSIQVAWPEAAVTRAGHGIEPSLCRGSAFVDMDMWRFTRFVAVKIETETVRAKNRGQQLLLFAIRQRQ